MTPIPDGAARKLLAIEQEAADASALVNSTRTTLGVLESEALRCAESGDETRSNALAVELQAKRGELQARRRRETTARQTVNQIKHWLNSLPGSATLGHFEAKAASVGREELSEAISRVRKDVASLQQQLIDARRAPAPTGELKVKASEFVTGLAAKGRPRIDTAGGRFEVRWLGDFDPLALVAWLMPQALESGLHREIDQRPDAVGGISNQERAALLSRIEADLLDRERTEEALVCVAIKAGLDVQRRVNADPRAVLGVQLVIAAKAA